MQIIYRISDGSHNKAKLFGGDKFVCLRNALEAFSNSEFHIFADNCQPETISRIREVGLSPIELALGNSDSWRYVLDYALQNFSGDEIVYFLEDDYLHLPGSESAISQALEIADYVSLYDHPDKYPTSADGEETRILRTSGHHWKLTASTTMTFAVKISTLSVDRAVWQKHTRTNGGKNERLSFLTTMARLPF